MSISKPNSTPVTLSDTSLIIANFTDEGLFEDLNAKLSPADKAHDLAIRSLLEDKLSFYQVRVFLTHHVTLAHRL
jgi:hypothetical protein